MTGLYIHIPFCHAKCHYCDFAAYPGRAKEIPRYLDALHREIRSSFPSLMRGEHARRADGGAAPLLETLFVGGGTPTVLSPEQWKDLLSVVKDVAPFATDHEATTECNPESTTPELLDTFRAIGLNRLSFGLQATQDRLLKSLGRLHDFARFESVYRDARAAGFDNINIDLMYGLPGQTVKDWQETVEKIIALAPEHVSAYALTVEEETVFAQKGVGTNGDAQADMYEWASDRLQAAGYAHYEISNFARPGRACRHNLRYWKNLPCLGVGVSAAGYDGARRRKNTDDITDYINALEAGRSPVIEDDVLAEEERLGEDLMLALRLSDGADLSDRARALYGPALARFHDQGFLTADLHGRRYVPTRRGWLLSNQLFQALLSPTA